MKKIYLWVIPTIISSIAFTGLLHADDGPDTIQAPVVNWVSKASDDFVTIENGNGATLNIVINVDNNTLPNTPGVTIKNCGDTTHIDAGSSAVCVTSDPDYPVSFSADTNNPVTGNYQITQQLPVPPAPPSSS